MVGVNFASLMIYHACKNWANKGQKDRLWSSDRKLKLRKLPVIIPNWEKFKQLNEITVTLSGKGASRTNLSS